MSITVPYSAFQNPDNTLSENGGSWVIQRSSNELYCYSGSRTGGCASQGCLTCTILEGAVASSYNLKYIVNVSIPMSQYGNVNSLDYNFAYHFKWTSDQVDAGRPLSTQLNVGTSSNTDNFISSDHAALWFTDNPVLGDPFSHSGTTSLLKSADGATAYIPITVDFSFSRPPGLCMWYLVARTFRITTLTSGGTSPSSGSNSSIGASSSVLGSNSLSPTGSVTSISGPMPLLPLSSMTVPGFSPQTSYAHDNGGSTSSSPSDSDSTRNAPTATIVGGVIGGISLLGIVVLVILLLYKRKQRRLRRKEWEVSMQNVAVAGGNDEDVLPMRISATMAVREPYLGQTAFSSLDEIKPTRSSNDLRPGVNVPVAPVFTVPSSVVTSQLPSHQPDIQRPETHAPRRGHQTLFSPVPTIDTDVPPPAYSTVNSTSRNANEGSGEHTNEADDGYDAASTVLTTIRDDLSIMQSESVYQGSEARLMEKNRRHWTGRALPSSLQ
ncbi:hypothetical protein FRC16_001530 [Serendipita sp. 398]|nr:hypothetical protein FRC16_001530 [Serendipita sp. 398]